MGKQPGTELVRRRMDTFPKREFIKLGEDTFVLEEGVISPVLDEAVTVITPDPRPRAVDGSGGLDFYVAWWRKGVLAPTAYLLKRISKAAGVEWEDPVFEYPPTEPGHRRVLVKARGGVRKPNGELVSVPGSFGLDTAVLEEKWLEEARQKAASKRRGERRAKTEEEILEDVRKRVLDMKVKYEREAETKAKSRVLRDLLGVPQEFTPQQTRMQIVVPQVIAKPGHAEAIERGRRATAELGYPETDTGALPSRTEQPSPDDRSGGVQTVAGGAAKEAEPTRRPSPDETPPAPPEPPEESTDEGPAGPTDEGPAEPKEDPFVDDLLAPAKSPYPGERMSQVAEQHPDFMQGLARGGRTKKIRELAAAWLSWSQPTLDAGGGQ